MCGLTGFWGRPQQRSNDEACAIAQAMSAALIHRGPDDSGVWSDANAGIAMGFRRLAIVDLTSAGHQPMISRSGRYVLVFNGEVYNFERLRAELAREGASAPYRGHSDTEVVLNAFETWGIVASTKKFIGMFAMAIWDREERKLHLLRDRVGVKPLYYGRIGSTWLFGSELKALREFPGFDAEINRDALAAMMRHSYIPAPHTIYRGIMKVQPGTIVTIGALSEEPTIETYWNAREVAESGVASLISDERSALATLEELLTDSIALRMVADVPLGVFLSGGIDSSIVTALMQKQSTRPIRTFSIGFHEKAYDEATYARAVAKHLGTDHTELYVTPREALAVIPRLGEMYDEPFADSSQIPTFLVSALARTHVTVALSGDGGDELFGGYNRYVWGPKVWQLIARTPRRLRYGAARLLKRNSPAAWDRTFERLSFLLPSRLRHRTPGDKLAKLAEALSVRSPAALHQDLTSHWKETQSLVPGSVELSSAISDPARWANVGGVAQQMMFVDLVSFLPDDILAKVDRASMATSLEVREPLLDHRLVEFAWRLPLHMKVRHGKGKWLLRQLLNRHVPSTLIERPKTGFGVPIDQWLRGPLREWAESLLNVKRLREEGYLRPELVQQVWHEHLSGARNLQHHIWDVLMFQSWLDANRHPARSGSQTASVVG